jgi:hypothetical protein
MQELFTGHPELFDEMKELVESLHYFLHDAHGADGDMDVLIDAWNGFTIGILEAAREIPSLHEWVCALDAFRERELAKVMASEENDRASTAD